MLHRSIYRIMILLAPVCFMISLINLFDPSTSGIAGILLITGGAFLAVGPIGLITEHVKQDKVTNDQDILDTLGFVMDFILVSAGAIFWFACLRLFGIL